MEKLNRNKYGKKSLFISTFYFLFFILISLNFVSAFNFPTNQLNTNNLGIFQQGKNITLFQSCQSCSYVKLTSINSPDGKTTTPNNYMEKNNYSYTYNFSNTNKTGIYHYTTCGDKNGTVECETIDFNITPSGKSESSSTLLIIIMFVLFYGLIFFGINIKNEWITLGGTFGLLILSIFTALNGIGDFQNNMTKTISYITLLIGLGIGFETLREIIDY